MKIQELMNCEIAPCSAQDTLLRAAELMRNGRCGCLAVVDGEHRPVAVVTDRDITMVALRSGLGLGNMYVWEAMSKKAFTCYATDEALQAARIMNHYHVRSVPIIDAQGKLLGMLNEKDVADLLAEMHAFETLQSETRDQPSTHPQ